MYHSIFFGDKNTWDDWHIVPTSRPVLKPPVQKTNYLDIPGADGSMDLSESLTGYPVYNDREGSFEFLVMNGYQPWNILYSMVLEHIHGQTMRMILEDDTGYFYEGTFAVQDWNSKEPPWSKIVVDYKVGPYKWSIISTTEDWLWDTFNFETGKVPPAIFRNIVVDSDDWIVHEFDKRFFEGAPVCPDFIVSSFDGNGIDARYINEHLRIDKTQHLDDGSNVIPEFIFYGEQTYTIFLKGHGTVSIEFRSGRL